MPPGPLSACPSLSTLSLSPTYTSESLIGCWPSGASFLFSLSLLNQHHSWNTEPREREKSCTGTEDDDERSIDAALSSFQGGPHRQSSWPTGVHEASLAMRIAGATSCLVARRCSLSLSLSQ